MTLPPLVVVPLPMLSLSRLGKIYCRGVSMGRPFLTAWSGRHRSRRTTGLVQSTILLLQADALPPMRLWHRRRFLQLLRRPVPPLPELAFYYGAVLGVLTSRGRDC